MTLPNNLDPKDLLPPQLNLNPDEKISSLQSEETKNFPLETLKPQETRVDKLKFLEEKIFFSTNFIKITSASVAGVLIFGIGLFFYKKNKSFFDKLFEKK